MSNMHGDEDEDRPEPARSSNWKLIVACAVAVVVLAAGAVVIGLRYRSSGAGAGAESPPRAASSATDVPGCGQPMADAMACGLPSGAVPICRPGADCPYGAVPGDATLPVSLPDWLARLPVPVTLHNAGTTRHGEVRLGTALAVVDVTTELDNLVSKVECQARADDGRLSKAALDFVRACGVATVPAGDQSAKATTDWLAAHVRPVDERQPHLGWYCGPLHAQLIMDRGSADLEVSGNELPADACRESDL